ncbi:hypothetical protein GE107_05925 [Cohnella sp. CFH 77786]|uniref:hypothetical protein n=1 Tax=Cohnella sp. CFH 77786 TaxID=2662265 RepID=UPI001C60EAC8|nr:hypothetical protein [Cohnella sp. CFH 77786]MBW5445600.1 hypothetical protein [Cohnella sp. CFH 77786]
MKKAVKAIGMTAALAVMIPFSAYAATTTSGSDTSAQSSAAQTDKAPPAREFHIGKGAVDQTVLDLLKLDQATLKTKLSEGKTLAEIAAEQGVSRDALKQALTDAFNKKLEEQKQEFSANLDNMIDAKGNAFPDRGFGGMKGFAARDLTSAATILGLSETDLKTALQSGKSLADLAKEKNVDVQKLIDAQKEAITAAINQAVKNGKLTQAQADKQLAKVATLAEKIVNSAGFPGGHGGHGDHGGHSGHGGKWR